MNDYECENEEVSDCTRYCLIFALALTTPYLYHNSVLPYAPLSLPNLNIILFFKYYPNLTLPLCYLMFNLPYLILP